MRCRSRSCAQGRDSRRLPAQQGDQLAEVPRRLHLVAADRRRFTGVLRRHDQPPHLLAAGPGGDGQHAADRAESSVEGQLADEERARQRRRVDDARRGEHPDGDRDVVGGAVLAQIGRRQVDRDPARRQLEAAVLQRAADPNPPLANAGVGQPDDVAAGEADRHVDLDVDRSGFDSHHRGGGDTREHAARHCEPSASPLPRFSALTVRRSSAVRSIPSAPRPAQSETRAQPGSAGRSGGRGARAAARRTP